MIEILIKNSTSNNFKIKCKNFKIIWIITF